MTANRLAAIWAKCTLSRLNDFRKKICRGEGFLLKPDWKPYSPVILNGGILHCNAVDSFHEEFEAFALFQA